MKFVRRQNQADQPPDKPGWPANWQDEIKADLDAQVANGATLYGIREDGAYIARTKDGDRVIHRCSQKFD